MNTTIIRKSYLTSDQFTELHSDTKAMYNYLLLCPDKQYINVFPLSKNLAVLCTGLSVASVDAGVRELAEHGFVEVYEGYVCLLKGHVLPVGGMYGKTNERREIEKLPVNVRQHFELDSEDIIVVEETKKTPKKAGPKPETIKDIINRQPEILRPALQDFIDDRIERKKAPSTRAVKSWIDKLQKMHPNDYALQVRSIQQSIERGWSGVFEAKLDPSERKFM